MRSIPRGTRTAALVVSAAPVVTTAQGIDQRIQDAVTPFTDFVARCVFASITIGGTDVPLILLWLIAISIFCTFYFGFVNVRGFAQGFRIIRGDYHDPKSSGDVSHFQALATALSGTVGLGNIAGVALAITVGGPGATFWMIVAGIVGMSAKFCECTLAVMYRRENPNGTISGGPMHYLSIGIRKHYPKLAPLGKVLAVVFAASTIGAAIGAGNLFQSNGALQALTVITGGEQSWLVGRGWIFGVVMAVLVGIVIVGGIRSIANVTDKLVPFMALIYMIGGFVVIFAHLDRVPEAFAAIWNGAFSPEGIQGGVLGVMLTGFRRAAFSNEAGVGSAAIAHSAVRTNEPVTEGLVSLWEPFIDTVVICTMTALVIVISDAVAIAPPGQTGVALTATAFGTVMSWFPQVLAVAAFLFAYATMIAYAYYGLKGATYLFGETRTVENVYKIIFLGATVVGCTMDFRRLTDFSDAVFFMMAIPNVIGLYLLAPVVKREMKSYFERLKAGTIRPYREAPEHPTPSL